MVLVKYEFPQGRIILRIKGYYIELSSDELRELKEILQEN